MSDQFEKDPLKVAKSRASKLQAEDLEVQSGCLSRWTLTWISGIIRKASTQKRLSFEDCWRHGAAPADIYAEFEQLWEKEKQKSSPKLMRVIWAMSKQDFRFGAFCWGLGQCIQVLLPVFLYQVVRFVELWQLYKGDAQCRQEVPGQDAHLCNFHVAISMIVVFCVFVAGSSLLMGRAQVINIRMALRFRTAIAAAIFRKATRLSSIGAGASSAGQISNLVSNDAQQFLQFAPMLHMAWSGPIFSIASFAMLAYSIGVSFLSGLGVICLMLPIVIKCMGRASFHRKAMLQFTDERIKLVNDVLNGLRVIKAYGWELPILDKIAERRKDEVAANIRRALWTCGLFVIVFLAPVINAIAVFSTFAALGGSFTASRVFMALAAMNSMRFSLIMGPFLLNQYINLKISTMRLQGFISLDELPLEVVQRPMPMAFLEDKSQVKPVAVECRMQNAKAAWAVAEPVQKGKGTGKGKSFLACLPCGKKPTKTETSEPEARSEGKNICTITKAGKEHKVSQVIMGIDFKAEPCQLTAIVGPTGCGKSSLIQCLLGTMELMEGTCKLEGTVAYVAQQALILNDTIKKNITLKEDCDLSDEDEAYYQRVLTACCLRTDLELLPGEDYTELGERGLNLSGGQKQRISIARAVFSRADVVILDDPLSAVDAHVARYLMDQVISEEGMLAGKTRILVTHQVQFLANAHNIFVLGDGQITQVGSFQELVAAEHLQAQEVSDEITADRRGETHASQAGAPQKAVETSQKTQRGSLVMAEEREEGELQLAVVRRWIMHAGVGGFSVYMLSIIIQIGAELCTQSWLAAWTSGSGMGTTRGQFDTKYYVIIYICLGFCQGVFLFIRNYLLQCVLSKNAANGLLWDMAKSVFHAKVVFFDRNPIGRILNRFTRDMEYLDVLLVQNISQFMNCAGGVVGAVVMISIIYPYFVIVALIMAFIYHSFTRYFRHASRELQRLEAVSRSPIFTLLSETQAGIATINGYGIGSLIIRLSDDVAATNTGIFYLMTICSNWLQIRLDIIAITILMCVTIFPTVVPELVEPGYVGLAIAYCFDMNQLLKHMARMGADVEQKFNAVDRLVDYADNIDQEPDWETLADKSLPSDWPTAGHVCFQDVTMRYRSNLEPALKNISFEVNGGEKVGVCGRTGSGKSSLIIALLRMTECEGRIAVDGVDLHKLGLHTVRQRISMIPQDPVLFSANLRSNIDPLEQADNDEPLLGALKLVCLAEEVEKLGGLEFKVAEGGGNFSVGQRQLLCLARAILRRSHLVLLDEATASVDHETDEIIQRTIRSEFKTSTVMTIAHRLNTILDSDRILVLDKGNVGEFDTPQSLAREPTSLFHKLLHSAGCKDFLAAVHKESV